ncbi:MAG TPA: hypothetical protein VK897_17955 [Anaerolineales bacterium]|nr:hypothetical protein [Anaerolineales bacterium]
MKQPARIAILILFTLALFACAPVTPAATEEPVASPESVPGENYYPLTTRTGIEHIDQILAAVASDDPQNLRALAEFFPAECTNQDGLGGPPKCREGEAEGTPVEVIAFLSGEGGHIRKDEIENWTGVNVSGLYAVYEVNTAVISSEQYYPVGEYVILLLDENDRDAVALRVGERGIVRMDTIFDASPENLNAMIEREAATVILPPVQ